MGLKPVKVFVASGGYIVREEGVSSNVTLQKGESLVLAYNSSDFTLHSKLIKPVIVFNAVRVPSADGWDVSYYNCIMEDSLSVGSVYTFDRTGCAYSSYVGKDGFNQGRDGRYAHDGSNPIRSSGKYVFFYATKNAYNTSGNVGTLTEDQTFTFSNFDLTYTESTIYSFTVEPNFSGGYKNHSKPNVFELSAVYHEEMIPQYVVASGTFFFKKSGASTYRSISFEGKSVTVPAGAFETLSTYDVYFTAVSTEGDNTSTPVVTLSTTDGTATVSQVSPINAVTHGEVLYSWNYSNVTGESQYAFDLQTSSDNSTWTTIFSHVVTSDTTVMYTQSSAGDTYWRVRGYNQNDIAGDWSESVRYVNNVPPRPPVILDVVLGGRIQVRWSAENQISYRVQVMQNTNNQLVYDSGDVYGTESLALVNTYLPNGNYTVRVRISNIYGNESPWSSTVFQQSSELASLDYSASYSEQNNGVTINVYSDEFEKYYILRNGELVAQMQGSEYTDHFASGKTDYRIIGVTSEDLFAQASFTIDANVPTARLITLSGTVFTVSERWNSLNNVEQSEEIRYSANEYLGQTAPEHIFSKMRLKRFTRAFYDPNRTASDLLGTVAYYADEYGNGDWVAITSVSRSDAWIGDDTNLEMQVTTRNEAISYDV